MTAPGSASTSTVAQALVLEAPRRLVMREFPLPEIGDDDGLLRVEACGLCGTDHEQFTGVLNMGRPVVPGHEIVGVVEAVGPRAAARWGVQAGDRVAVEPSQSCRACDQCRAGDYRHCARHPFPDFYGVIPADRSPGLWGGYADHVYLGPDAVLLPVPDELDPVAATLFNPLGAGIRWAVQLPRTQPGDIVAVLGPGIRGLCAAAAAKDAGAEFVMVTGLGPHDGERLGLASRFGADLTVDVARDDPVTTLRQTTGTAGADVVVDVTAKAPDAFVQAIGLARPGGRVIVAGTRGPVPVDGFIPDAVVVKELHIIGALGVDVDAYRPALDLLATARWPFAELPRRCVGLDGVEGLLQIMAGETGESPPVHGVVVPAIARPT